MLEGSGTDTGGGVGVTTGGTVMTGGGSPGPLGGTGGVKECVPTVLATPAPSSEAAPTTAAFGAAATGSLASDLLGKCLPQASDGTGAAGAEATCV